VFRVAAFEIHIEQACFSAARLGLFEHLLRCVESDRGGCGWRYGSCDDTRATGNIEQVALPRAAQRGPGTPSNLIISLLRPMVESFGLSPKFVDDALKVIHRILLHVPLLSSISGSHGGKRSLWPRPELANRSGSAREGLTAPWPNFLASFAGC